MLDPLASPKQLTPHVAKPQRELVEHGLLAEVEVVSADLVIREYRAAHAIVRVRRA